MCVLTVSFPGNIQYFLHRRTGISWGFGVPVRTKKIKKWRKPKVSREVGDLLRRRYECYLELHD